METKRFIKFLALLLAEILLVTLVFTGFANKSFALDSRTGLAADYSGKTVILHSNDVHGALEGYATIAKLKSDLEARGAEVILADAGDFSQGTPYVSLRKGASAVEMMNAAGYDIVTLGNHEFDYGYANLMENLKDAKFKTICADVFLRESGESILDGHVLCETESGLKLGFFGMETPETATKVNPGMIQEIDFAFGKDLYTVAQKEIDALKEEGAQLVIGLVHLGVDDESAANGHRSVDLYDNVTGVDLLLDGHSHTVMTEAENGAPIQSTGTKFEYIGVVVIDNESGKIEEHFLVPTEGLAQDETVAAAAKAIIDTVDEEYGKPFAKSEVTLNGERSPNGNRDSQTNNGNLITDAMIYCVMEDGSVDKVPAENIVAITNGGGIRAAVEPGDVSMKDINTVLPFGNTVAVIYVTGAELLEALEASTYSLPIGGYPQTAGIRWTLNTTLAFDQGELYIVEGKETTYYAPASIRRVSIESINGKPFDPEATYGVVTNNFVAAGGDTYAVFNVAYQREGELAGFDTSIPLDEAVVSYIQEVLDGVISAEKYAADRGDLTMITLENSTMRFAQAALTVDGEAADAEYYEINGERYYKLRDIAALLRETDACFEVGYDAETNSVTVTTGKAYTMTGDELLTPADHSSECVQSEQSLSVNGKDASLTAFNIDGYNYFRFSELAGILGIQAEQAADGSVSLSTAA